ncbi:MAG: hypothetical protein VCB26_13150 [Candidatus Hydrogenedentota bacterium]
MNKYLTAITLILALTTLSSANAADWSRFRGPNGTGVDDSSPLPDKFGLDKNVLWKINLPSSSSSPVFVNGAVFVTASDEENLIVQRINAKTGKPEWKRKIKRARNSKIHVQNDSASPTPVVDEKNSTHFSRNSA